MLTEIINDAVLSKKKGAVDISIELDSSDAIVSTLTDLYYHNRIKTFFPNGKIPAVVKNNHFFYIHELAPGNRKTRKYKVVSPTSKDCPNGYAGKIKIKRRESGLYTVEFRIQEDISLVYFKAPFRKPNAVHAEKYFQHITKSS